MNDLRARVRARICELAGVSPKRCLTCGLTGDECKGDYHEHDLTPIGLAEILRAVQKLIEAREVFRGDGGRRSRIAEKRVWAERVMLLGDGWLILDYFESYSEESTIFSEIQIDLTKGFDVLENDEFVAWIAPLLGVK